MMPEVDCAEPWPAQAVVVANHASYLDGLVLAAVLPAPPVFIAKRELAGQFFAGRFLRALGAVFVERLAPERGVEDTRAAEERARSSRLLVAFPEGTFTRAPGLRAFKMGAFVIAAGIGLPVVPVTIRGTRSVLRADAWFPRHGRIAVHVGPAILPAGADFDAAVALRDRARAAILRRYGEPDLGGDAGA
jgi:1-acyl-sn-glycerol-3-phosphate acyltransferase